jgi:putative ABC transport system permease protein
MLQDLRHALRGLTRSPGFTTVAVLTLALGIGANTAVFSLTQAVFSSPLPFAEADRLVSVWERREGSRDANIPVSGHEYAAWKDQNQVFEQMALYRPDRMNLTGTGDPEAVQVVRASASYLPLLRIEPAVGRAFAEGEDAAGPDRVAILSDRLWRSRFGADEQIVGQSVTLNDQSYTVIGVLGPLPPSLTPDVLLPLDVPGEIRAVGRHNLSVIGRLRPDVTIDRAASDLSAITLRLSERLPDQNTGHFVALASLRESLVGEFRAASLLMMAAVGVVLLIGCANVANLLLARGANRQKEIAVRMALGAGRARIVRQLLVESLVLAMIGGAAGLLVCAWLIDVVKTVEAVRIPLLETASLQWTGLVVAAGISLCTGLGAGIAPGLRSSRVHPAWLREGSRMSDDRGRQRLRSMLVAAEVALTLILLVGAGLLITSFVRLTSVNPGFDVNDVLVVPVDLPATRYREAHQRRAFYDRVIGGVAGVAGVSAAGAVSHLPLGGADNWMPFKVEGGPAPARGQEPYAPFRVATPRYFETLRIPLRRGRAFMDGDAREAIPVIRWFPQQPYPAGFDKAQAPPVAIVSEAAARQFFGDQDPIGKRIGVMLSPAITIVGVVGDVKHNGLNLPSHPHIYLPHSQEPWNSFSLVVRASGPAAPVAAAVREQIRAADAALPVAVKTMEEVLAASTGRPRLYALVIGLFGVVALALALVGIFGVVSYVATQRTQEIGVRMALGAQRREIFTLVVGQGMRPIACGIAVGFVGAVGLTRFIETLLFGVAPLDPLTFGIVIVLLSAAGLIACWIPARRATRVDPLTALRAE